MASPLVGTKLFIPQPRRKLVARPRLSARLSRGAEAKLTLISAPAGFGKTTALAAWLAHPAENRSVAWLSLEESDRQPASFWTYLVTALQTVSPDLGGSVLPLLQSAQAPIETVLATLLNELSTLPNDLDVVLDDYHLADGPDVAGGMVFLLEHLPRQVHVVLSTRVDPDLPLARLRARGDLVEVRAADLRFTREEVAAYLTGTAGLDLTSHDITVLAERTEGWIAALQLAALSMDGKDNVADFIATFAGDDRYIVDYLVDEVLAKQPDHGRSFLIQTSILDRLCGPLCDAVTGQEGGKATLEALDRANLFVVPLDDSRRWYRYHHLFADVLRTHLRDERPAELGDLHRRASRWYDQAREPSAAVGHALASGDVERAADLVERAIPALQRDRQEATIRSWLDQIPDEVVRARPVLATGFIGALMSRGEFDQVPGRLRDVERLLHASMPDVAGGPRRPSELMVVDEAELARLRGTLELYWAGLALVAGDASGTHRHAQQAIERATPDDHVTRAGASALSGLAFWGAGDLEAAHRGYSTCVEGLRRAGHISDVLGCSVTLADIRITQGRLGEALATYESALQLASQQPVVLRGTADMYLGISQIALERGDLPTARDYLGRAEELGEHLGLPQNPYRRRVAMARVLQVEGDCAGAIELLEDAERVYTGDFSPNVRPIGALKAGILAAAGNVDHALAWAREHGLSHDDDLSYVREYEHITLARVLLAQYTARRSEASLEQAAGLLERLLAAAEQGERTGSVIEVLLLQALTQHARGDVAAALSALQHAMALAEPEGYVRVFVGEGAPMGSLLRRVAADRPTWAYARRLVDVFGAGGIAVRAPSVALVPDPLARNVVDPLSERELEVLRLLASDLDGPGLARHLVVSLNTLRTHTRHIYAKLGVNSRRAAVRRAGELNLFAGNQDS
jgi:LuxR family maltose regulon positive regulatory protein